MESCCCPLTCKIEEFEIYPNTGWCREIDPLIFWSTDTEYQDPGIPTEDLTEILGFPK